MSLPGKSSLLGRIAPAAFVNLISRELESVRYHKVLYVAQDVADGLASRSKPVSTTTLCALLGIDVVGVPESPPHSFRLVRHDACDVIEGTRTVSHARCTIVAEGTVEFPGEEEQDGRE